MQRVNLGSPCWGMVVGGLQRLAVGVIRRLGGVPIGELQRAQAALAAAQARIAELEAQAAKTKKATPDFVKANRPKKAEGEPRKKRTANFARKRETPTRVVEHADDQCPVCGTTLLGGTVRWSRQVLHVPIVPVEVIEHRFVGRQCPLCNQERIPPADLGEEVVGQHRVSAATMALIATLREVGRLPVRTIQWQLETFHGLHLSVGEISEVLHGVRRHAAPLVAALKEEVRASPVVNGDETGWREKGQNGYLWSFSTPHVRYFERHASRSGDVVEQILGSAYEGTVVSDFYGAYNRHEGRHQRCWAHMLRDAHALREDAPQDPAVQEWVDALKDLYHRARDWILAHPQATDAEREAAQHRFEAEAHRLSAPHVGQPVPQRVLSERIEKFLPELFVFVADPRVPATNNAAERALRPTVISRKISRGTRSEAGSKTKTALASLFGTWLARGQNPYTACLAALTSQEI
jgi:transposase